MLDKAAGSATGRAILGAILVVVILIPVVYSVFARVAATGAEAPIPPDEMYKECIRNTEYMRFHHWELLRGLREEVVRDGIRGALVPVETISEEGDIEVMQVEQSLDGCWRCHQSKVEFCDRCHDAATVRPDCFGCHYYPDLD